jgi:hypothetical protein
MKLMYGPVTLVLVFQSWHFVEYAVKLEQHVVNGCVSCPGILGHYFDPILLHLVYNTNSVYALGCSMCDISIQICRQS